MQQRLISEIKALLSSMPEDERIDAINDFRRALHEFSPFSDQPVDCVLWVKGSQVAPNDYNPNNVAPPEKRLLLKSLEADGFTQPIVVQQDKPDHYEIVDGFHRHELGKGRAALKKKLKGYLPATCLNSNRSSKSDRMASTIRHNRARGRHQISEMSEIILELTRAGWDDERIGRELGMDSDEVLRLKQINGLTELFAGRRFSRAWTVK
ncbi:IbrB-like domain-containing protein [Phytobacter massiliensis]|uniref:IbrB-like domain-containing protein n=1 Tax=Phytobacter massiliensis TaxID=1485952 RepID=UPI0002DAC867|nr:ParB/RepB/Spo0J family partition protein [Phytobacter massiliensis]